MRHLGWFAEAFKFVNNIEFLDETLSKGDLFFSLNYLLF